MLSLKKRKKKIFLENKLVEKKKSFFSQKGVAIDNFVDFFYLPVAFF
jgi:hypothetical protein